MPYLELTTILHLHVRINQADHPLEDAKSFGLNEIIDALVNGSSGKQLVQNKGTIYCSSYPVGELIYGVEVRTVPNVKRDWQDIFKNISPNEAIYS